MNTIASLSDHRREKLLTKLRLNRARLLAASVSVAEIQIEMDPLIDEIEHVFSALEWHQYDRYLDDLFAGYKNEMQLTFGVLDQAIKELEHSLSARQQTEEHDCFVRTGIMDEERR